MIRSAWLAITSIGRSPRRMTSPTPRKMSTATATEPVATMSLTRSTVASTSLRLVPATRVPEKAGTETADSWYCWMTAFPAGGLAPVFARSDRTILAAAWADSTGPGQPGPPCRFTTCPRAGTNPM